MGEVRHEGESSPEPTKKSLEKEGSVGDIELGSGHSFGGQQWLAGAASEACG